jgi:hypothetical protein
MNKLNAWIGDLAFAGTVVFAPIATLVVLGLAFSSPAGADLKVASPHFAAYAINDEKRMGAAFRHRNQNEASQAAIRVCGGAKAGCRIIMEIHAKCIAFAESFQNGYWIGTAGAPDLARAQELARNFCAENAPRKTCKIRHSTC